MTVIELLIVMAIIGIVLSLLTAFFRTQVRVSASVQARNEVETKLRGVAEILMQDLQLAGSRAVYDGTTVQYLNPIQTTEPSDPASTEWAAWKATQCSGQHRDGCVVIGAGGVNLTIYYATSLDRGAASACRRIDYLLDATGVLFRRDVECDDTTTPMAGYSFASGITDINVTFICHDPDTTVTAISSCYTATTYPREATVTIQGSSENSREAITSTVTLATSLPNLRPPVDYLDL